MSENKSKLGHEKALWAVDRARDYLQKLGHTVSLPNHVCAKGADLHLHVAGRKTVAVEVKLVMWNKKAWRVNRVTRKKDEFIAFVFPSGAVHLESMKDHLALTNRSGDRYLTALGRIFE